MSNARTKALPTERKWVKDDQTRWRKQQESTQHQYICTRLHGVTTQKKNHFQIVCLSLLLDENWDEKLSEG